MAVGTRPAPPALLSSVLSAEGVGSNFSVARTGPIRSPRRKNPYSRHHSPHFPAVAAPLFSFPSSPWQPGLFDDPVFWLPPPLRGQECSARLLRGCPGLAPGRLPLAAT